MRGLRPSMLVVIFAIGLLETVLWHAAAGPKDNLPLELLVLASVASAALSFQRDDPPRRPWTTLTVAVALLFGAHLATRFTPNYGVVSMRHVLTLAHNVAWMVALYWFGRVLRRSGVRRRWRGRARGALVALAAAAVVLAAYAVWRIWAPVVAKGAAATAYDVSLALVNGSSAVANAFVLVVAIDLARALVPMRGGAVALPYTLLASGAAGLLTIDLAAASLGASSYVAMGPIIHHLMALSWTSVAAAGIAQTVLIRGAMRAS